MKMIVRGRVRWAFQGYLCFVQSGRAGSAKHGKISILRMAADVLMLSFSVQSSLFVN